ncbi:hypothetical protein [Spirosoma sp. KNUC1025]|uniref:hypothetical protein n=1 Tax=Spirosoma sp. KNUC1025 TaxID=2894082 RepID=UPI00386EF348|nr:hypothetical protein LN737_19320 [Spirosoma sp. KNUC1025]
MKITYTYKNTKVTIDQPGPADANAVDELCQRIHSAPATVQVSLQADDGTVFFGTVEELNILTRCLQNQIFKPSSN